MIAALYVQSRGCYFNLPGVDPWPEERNALLYGGPWPVVAHPPCARWCQLAGLVESRYGYKKGDDGGTFAHALEMVRRWGGVLEHPAYSHAWAAHDLNRPPPTGDWVAADFLGGWTIHVEQRAFGHRARKATWLYAMHVALPSLPRPTMAQADAMVSYAGRNKPGRSAKGAVVRLDRREASATPVAFRNMLLTTAATARHWVRGQGATGDASLGTSVELMSSNERAATPARFRDWLLSIAGSAC